MIKSGENLATLQSEMEPKELIEPLSEVIRKYPRSGGPDPKGLQILRGGKIWGEGSADPEEVAKLLLGTQFDGKKATASCFKAAGLVTAHYGWSLSWKEDFSLGAYLISCLVKAKLYKAWKDFSTRGRPDYWLAATKKQALEFPEIEKTAAFKPCKENTALGMVALSSNTTGNFNTATGRAALKSSKTGSDNTANGAFALERNTTGRGNSAFGAYALRYTSTNEYDSAFGYHTLWKSKGGGGRNAAFGAAALRDTELGTRNTAIGFRAGGKNINGNNNVFIGYEAGYRNYYRYQIDKLVIANGKDSRNELITGDFRAHTVNINGDLHATGNVTTSDARLKKDIQPLTHALDAVLQLQAKTYRWTEDTAFADQADIGLVAQEVEKVFPELVAENEQGYKGIAYSKLTAVLIEAMKEQQGQLIAQQDQIASLEKENTQLKTIIAEQMDALLARVAMLEGASLAAN